MTGVWILWVVIAVGSLLMMARWAAVTEGLTIPGVFIVTYFLIIYAGAPAVYVQHPGPTADLYLATVMALPMLFPFGCLAANVVFRFDPRRAVSAYFNRPVTAGARGPVFQVLFLALFGFGVALSVHYARSLQTIPLLETLRGTRSPNELALLREAATSRFTEGFYLANLGTRIILPFATAIAFAKVLNLRNLWWLLMFLASLAVTLPMQFINLQKLPLVMFALLLAAVYFLTRRRFRLRTLFVWGTGVLLILGVFVYLIHAQLPGTKSKRLELAFTDIGNRIFVGQTEPLYYYVDYFPQHHPFVPGQTIGLLAQLFHQQFFPENEEVMQHGHPEAVAEHASAQTVFTGEMYANLGFVGMLLCIPLVAFILQAAQVWLTRTQRDPLGIALYAYVAIGAAYLSMTNALRVLSSCGVGWVILFAFLIRLALVVVHPRVTGAPALPAQQTRSV